MQARKVRFSNATVTYIFGGTFSRLKELVSPATTVLITDEHVFAALGGKFKGWKTIVIPPGEAFKVQATVDSVIQQLIDLGADRKTTLVGVGGGVITDLTGYVASVYMRGIAFGFVPTTLLSLVDASIGGKNGIDVGVYKNMVGTIRQPSFILHDLQLLKTLPDTEWRNGFAEIIKHACIRDASMFRELEAHDLPYYQKKREQLAALVQRNALLKTKVVQADEFENGDRKLLNFGHTLGHAVENMKGLSHGEAISIGMAYATKLSEQYTRLKGGEKVVALLQKYGLPVTAEFDREQVIQVLRKDKKKSGSDIHFILLQRIGKAVIETISFDKLYQTL